MGTMFSSSFRSNQMDSGTSSTHQSGTGHKTAPPNPSQLSRATRRDPATLPLALIIGGVMAAAGYFALTKAPKEGGGTEAVGPRKGVKADAGIAKASLFYPRDSNYLFDSTKF